MSDCMLELKEFNESFKNREKQQQHEKSSFEIFFVEIIRFKNFAKLNLVKLVKNEARFKSGQK